MAKGGDEKLKWYRCVWLKGHSMSSYNGYFDWSNKEVGTYK